MKVLRSCSALTCARMERIPTTAMKAATVSEVKPMTCRTRHKLPGCNRRPALQKVTKREQQMTVRPGFKRRRAKYLSEIEEETGILSSFRKVRQKDRDAYEENSGILANLPERLWANSRRVGDRELTGPTKDLRCCTTSQLSEGQPAFTRAHSQMLTDLQVLSIQPAFPKRQRSHTSAIGGEGNLTETCHFLCAVLTLTAKGHRNLFQHISL